MGNLRAINDRPHDGLHPGPGNNREQATDNDRRREQRRDADLAVTVWGIDTRGDRFLQEARACNISLTGALLQCLDVDLRSGDVIGILYAGQRARYRVVWVRESDKGLKVQAAIHRLSTDKCPWKDLLTEDLAASPEPADHAPGATHEN